MKVNDDLIIERWGEFVEYPGYLPSLVEPKGGYWEARNKFLRDSGLYEKVCEERLKHRTRTYKDDIIELKRWCDEHPEYSDFIINDE